jgi:hypothetical protein
MHLISEERVIEKYRVHVEDNKVNEFHLVAIQLDSELFIVKVNR